MTTNSNLSIEALGTSSSNYNPIAITEYSIPGASQTHELTIVNDGKLLVASQQSNSTLVKVALDSNGKAISSRSFQVGNTRSGLHGVFASIKHPGMIWLTLQFDSALVLIDPIATDLDAPPKVIQYIPIPSPGRGPHVVIEYGDELWATLKDSHHVIKINSSNPNKYQLFKVSRTPVFVAKHSNGKDVYVSIDQSSKIAHISLSNHTVNEIDIAPEKGATAVGLIKGIDGNIWFVLLGANTEGRKGTFGKIDSKGNFQWFSLPNNLGKKAGLLHLTFNPDINEKRLYLLGSSIGEASDINALFNISFDTDFSRIDSIESIALPTQYSKAHRVFYTPNGLYVTELSTSTIAHIKLDIALQNPVIDETSDYYALFGKGMEAKNVDYN